MTRLALLASAAALALAACSGADERARVDPSGPTSAYRDSFLPVARVLAARCGSLDCHGSAYRNFRVYGYGSARLPADDGGVVLPDQADTTAAEAIATYHGFVAVEPEKTRAVLDARGAGLDDLTVVRKARGAEAHEGDDAIVRGDDADRCLVSWFAGAVDDALCASAAAPR